MDLRFDRHLVLPLALGCPVGEECIAVWCRQSRGLVNILIHNRQKSRWLALRTRVPIYFLCWFEFLKLYVAERRQEMAEHFEVIKKTYRLGRACSTHRQNLVESIGESYPTH